MSRFNPTYRRAQRSPGAPIYEDVKMIKFRAYWVKAGKRFMEVGVVFAETLEKGTAEAERFFGPLGWTTEVEKFKAPIRSLSRT